MKKLIFILTSFSFLLFSSYSLSAQVSMNNLKPEYLYNPLGKQDLDLTLLMTNNGFFNLSNNYYYILNTNETYKNWLLENKFKKLEVQKIKGKKKSNATTKFTTLTFDETGKVVKAYYPKMMAKNVVYKYNEENVLEQILMKNNNDKTVGVIDFTIDSTGSSFGLVQANNKGRLYQKIEVKYDENGFPIQMIYCLKVAGNSMDVSVLKKDFRTKDCSSTFFSYDENGKLLQTTLFGGSQWVPFVGMVAADKLRSETNYTYDKNGKLVNVETLNSAGDKMSNSSYTYDENGNLFSEYNFDSKGLEGYSTYMYDENNRLKELKAFNSMKQLKKIISYSYNEDGCLTELNERNGKNKLVETITLNYTQ